ncbi:MAG: hypothetical protein AAFY56_20180 [Pseudomonadota bacterium]
MAYDSKNLSAISYANGFTLWHYRSEDLASEIDDAGYFNPASKMLRTGDFVFVNSGVEGLSSNGLAVISENDGGVVNVTNILPIVSDED